METVAAEPAVIAPAHCKADDILIIARQEFARLGYRGVTVRGIAEKAQVSTRTLYNHFTDKLGLFGACIEAGGANFPRPDLRPGAKPFDVLCDFAAALLRYLTSKGSMQLSLIVFRDGNAFPEIREAAKDNHERHVVRPIAEFLMAYGVDADAVSRLARLFSNMITSEWQRRILFGEPIMSAVEISEHAEHATKVFLNGVEIDNTA
jgi:AcrR family transcriptional regulator